MLRQPPRNDFTTPHRFATALSLAMGVFVGLSGVALAQSAPATGPSQLKQIENKIDAEKSAAEGARAKATIMARDIESLQDELVTAAAAVQRHEQQVEALQNRLTALERLQTKKSQDLRDGRERFGRVLGAMQRLAQFPPEALIAQPTKPADTVRTAILLRAVGGEIEGEAEKIRGELDFLVKARTEIVERTRALNETTELLDREKRRLGALMARKKVLKRRADQDAEAAERRVAQLADKAKSLRELMQGLAEEKRRREEKKPEDVKTAAKSPAAAAIDTVRRALRPIAKARGNVSRPVVGRLAGLYGEKTDGGLSRKGVTFETPKGAQVVATYDGTVVYAGKFRGYGLLLIIEHGEGYHTLLAGMTRIDVGQGQQVLAGEPVGVMDDDGNGGPVLYVELRRDGQPINPMPWLAASKNEVNG